MVCFFDCEIIELFTIWVINIKALNLSKCIPMFKLIDLLTISLLNVWIILHTMGILNDFILCCSPYININWYWLLLITTHQRMEKTRKPNWTKEEEFTLISEVELAWESLRGSGNCADINKKKKQLWINILTRVNSEHGNARSTWN